MAFQITITEDAESQMQSLSVREQRMLSLLAQKSKELDTE